MIFRFFHEKVCLRRFSRPQRIFSGWSLRSYPEIRYIYSGVWVTIEIYINTMLAQGRSRLCVPVYQTAWLSGVWISRPPERQSHYPFFYIRVYV